ncbi:Globin [Niveomyces insectorum RCEF 264]|uniref:nitric oxide dioxygenase n=1 Tax=Niveomyces insectorum RCEF 264 TaxID=1081102 RepID=A0A167RD00_9HYPO|nr:Globin [Niveomyces insectorum RCEF 264]
MTADAVPPQPAAAAALPTKTADGPAPRPSPPALTPEQLAIVKATAPVLQQQGVAITTLFYNNLLAAHPALKNVFSLTSQATGAQPRALAAAVLAYAAHIDDLGALHHAVERIAHKHASLQIQPAQYDLVGENLLAAIGTVLGDAATPAIVDAWTAAYALLADVFINREKALYDAAAARGGGGENGAAGTGWVGWRPFRVVRRAPATADGRILNLDLTPVDGRPLPVYAPGQYISLQMSVPALGVLQSRQYSLSRAPRHSDGDGDDNTYRISVKRDDGHGGATAPGCISNLVHDTLQVGTEVELSQPQGEFVVEEPAAPTSTTTTTATAPTTPLVLISAGVGATPLMAILEETVAQGQGRPIAWVHASRARSAVPFTEEVRALQAAHPKQITTRFVLTDVAADDDSNDGAADVVCGTRLKLADLTADERRRLLFVDNPRTGYYLCGPAGFMVASRAALEDMGVGSDRIHLELFETGDL